MDLLQPWIGPYVHQVLTEAQEWKVQSLQGSQPVATDIYEDDGSNLRVKSNRKGLVQFAKVSASCRARPDGSAYAMLRSIK